TECKKLLDVEPGRVGEETVDRAHGDDPRAGAGAGASRPGADLAEALDCDRRAVECAANASERSFGSCLDAMPRTEVVHPEPLERLRPDRQRVQVRLEEIGRRRPHVRTREEGFGVWLDRVLVRGEHRSSIAAGETNARLG